ncbi:hypothetical protein PILCRDRAFT_443724 [Piloderma croceum F 1598]|uniref:Uncharacterized protein n=1 Tax=Piloderma croceum (strain F 1598) TaxID=765440 RepID=A0A0C3BAW2_PILCF|nr:hypothetical protein PILCRDRAFT_443724 [Piloderma croceum F 1598]
MASRQNRKKKGRANQQNRERTVTTLTEGPNPQFLVPTPSEEPAGANMSSPFSVSSSSGAGPNNSIPNGGYQNFAYSGPPYSSNYMGPTQHGGNIQQPQFYQQQPNLPPGRDDLEILENLKAQIKSGQHNRFKATAQPEALLTVYREGLQSEAHYVQQVVTDYQGTGFNQMDYDSNSISQAGNRYGANNTNNIASSPSKPGNDTRSFPDSKTSANGSAGSDIAQPSHSKFGNNTSEQRGQDLSNQKVDQRRPPGDNPVAGEYGSRARALSDASPGKPLYDGKGDVRASRDVAWQQRDGPTSQDDKRGRPDPDRPGPPGRPNGNLDSRSNGNEADARGPVPRDQRFHDRDRNRDRDRDRDRERDWDRDRDRRPDFRRDARGMTDARRPPPEQRHYEPQYSSDLPRRNDNRPPAEDAMDVDKRPPPIATRPVPIDDRAGRPAPIDDRMSRAPPPDRSVRVPSIDDRQARPPSGDNRRAPSPENRNLRPAPPSQPIQDVPLRLSTADRNPVRGPLPPVDDHTARPPLEDRISRPTPSLQERITHPPASRADDRLTRQPSLEERISHAPAAVNDRSIPHADRVVRPSTADRTARPVEPIRPPVQEERMGRPDDRSVRPVPPNDRYARPVTPPQDRALPREAGYAAVPRSSSVRDDSRVLRPPSPSLARDYRPARALSRDRDLRPAHRPEVDRPYDADRRPDLMDVDPPARFNDRPPYPRHLTPPPAADRARGVYPPPLSPQRADSAYVDPDRRYPVGDRRDYPFDGRQRQLSGSEDESYWKSRPGWDRETLDKERIERAAPPARNNGWETREESERRNSFPGSPSTRSFDTSQQRPLGSRLTESYARPGEDRQYPPREHERPRYPPTPAEGTPAFSRVRPRSPSPMSRRPGPGSVVDDGRPPMKRAREDVPYTAGYYSPEPRRPAVAGGPSDYPSRTAPTPRPEAAPYYDGRGPPSGPPGGGRTGPPYDRDYPVARDRAADVGGYVPGPSSYPSRSPPPSRLYGGRGNYTRGDDRPYNNNMPPPPPRSS